MRGLGFLLILAITLGCGKGNTREAERLFFEQVENRAIHGEIVNHTAMTKVVVDLISRHTQVNSDLTYEATPYFIAGAIRSMYLKAQVHETDNGNKWLLQLMLSNPDQPYWANCGSSIDLMIVMLSFFGIDARPVTVFHTINDHHHL